ncbi:MAG: MFS transporter [Aureliella sp.]
MNQIIATYRSAFSGLPAGAWAFSFVLLVHRSGTMVLPFLSLHLKDHLGLTSGGAAQLLSVYGVGSICGAILGGRAVSKFGALKVMIASLLGAAPFFVALLYAQTAITAAVVIFLLAAVGDAVRPAAMTATASLCSGEKLGRAFALNRLAVNLGMSIGPAMAGLMYVNYFAAIFYIDAITCVTAAALVWWIFGAARMASELVDSDAAQHETPNSGFWRDVVLVSVLVQFCLVMIIFMQSIGSYPIYLRERYGLTEATIGLVFTINTGLIVLFEMVLIAWLDRFRKLPVIGIGCVLIALGFGILPLGSGLGFVCLAVVIYTLGEMLSMPLLTTWGSQRAPAHKRGQYMGAVTAAFSMSWVIAPVLGGALYRWSPDAVWYLALALAPVVAAGFAAVIRFERLSSSRPATTLERETVGT